MINWCFESSLPASVCRLCKEGSADRGEEQKPTDHKTWFSHPHIHLLTDMFNLASLCRCRLHLGWALLTRRRSATGESTRLERRRTRRQASPPPLRHHASLHCRHDTTLLFSPLSTSRPPPPLCKEPSSWASATRWATWAPSLSEMCWCRTSMWWRASSSPGARPVQGLRDLYACVPQRLLQVSHCLSSIQRRQQPHTCPSLPRLQV